MGDMRKVYRHIAPALTDSGLRLVTMDLRGMGESSVGWEDLSDEGVASDYLALVDKLDAGPAVLIGSSLSCASAVIAATDAPEAVSGIVLLGPFVRPALTKWWEKAVFVVALAPPWGRSAWVYYYRKNLYPGPRPTDLDEYVGELSRNLSARGRMAALRGLAANTHAESGRRIANVAQPVLVVMGTADPEFPDAVAEARQLGEVMSAEVLLVDGSGHYPQADSPQKVAPAIIELARRAGQ
jgi:pimeloyl-ACP methyl ester carboxylesterase